MKALATWTVGLAVLAAPAAALAQQEAPYYYGRHMWDGGWHGWFFGPLMMLLFVAAVVALVVLVARHFGGTQAPPGPAGRTPLDILKERFARGEIDKAEFEERRRVLGE